MLGNITFEHGGIRAMISNNLLSSLKAELFKARLTAFEDVPRLETWRNTFIHIAAYTVKVQAGLNWQPPTMNVTSDELMSSFELLFMQVDADTLNAWIGCINSTFEPLASDGEQGKGDAVFLASSPVSSTESTPTEPPPNSETPSRTPASKTKTKNPS
jgi:hypothetical protein